MSVATAFDADGPFPFCLSGAPPAGGYDYVDVSIGDAMALWWNLESLEFVSTGSKGSASINWTATFGPTENLPFTPGIVDSTRGAYYNPSTLAPAYAPSSRICNATGDFLLRSVVDISTGEKNISLNLVFRSATGTDVRIYYAFNVYDAVAFDAIIVCNPANSFVIGVPIGGTPPSSGTITILGITFNYVGGGCDLTTYVWTSETATLAASSAAFTY